jgi:ribosome-binding protein aMBF1 (putative translation factor)
MKKNQEICELCSCELKGIGRQLDDIVVCQDCYDAEYETN